MKPLRSVSSSSSSSSMESSSSLQRASFNTNRLVYLDACPLLPGGALRPASVMRDIIDVFELLMTRHPPAFVSGRDAVILGFCSSIAIARRGSRRESTCASFRSCWQLPGDRRLLELAAVSVLDIFRGRIGISAVRERAPLVAFVDLGGNGTFVEGLFESTAVALAGLGLPCVLFCGDLDSPITVGAFFRGDLRMAVFVLVAISGLG